MTKGIPRKAALIVMAVLLMPAHAEANNGNNAALGIGALLGALFVGVLASQHHEAPPPPPRIYSLREMAEWGNVNAQMRLAARYESQRDYTEALRWYLRAADKGNDENAQMKVAEMFRIGLGTLPDDAAAFSWYTRAAAQENEDALDMLHRYASQGNSYAQTGLGILYQNGLGEDQSDLQAVQWYQLAANQGNPGAQNLLGFMYENGRGVPQDYSAARRWYAYGARQGNPLAEASLGNLYARGKGVHMDKAKAYGWFSLASMQRNEEAAQAMRMLEPSMAPAEIEAAQARARNFSPQSPYSKLQMQVLNAMGDMGGFIAEF